MTMAIAIREPQGVTTDSLESKVELIKRTVAKGANKDELDIFMHQCRKTGLDPLARQIYFQKRKNWKTGEETMTILTGIDGYRLIADRTGFYAGNDDPIFDDDTAKIPKKATVTVYKIVGGQRCGFTASARWEQYYPGEKLGFMWAKMPHLMLGKCAEALALRKAFPAELSGVYTAEEMEQAGAPTSQSYEPELPAAEGDKPTVEGVISDIAQVKDSWFYKVGSETCTTNNEKFANKLAGAHGLNVKLEVHSQKLNGKVHVIVNVLDIQIPEDLTPLLEESVNQAASQKHDMFEAAESQASEFINDETGTVKGIVKTIRKPKDKGAMFVEVSSPQGTVASLSTFSKTDQKRLEESTSQAVILRFKRSDCGKYMNITAVERVGQVAFTEGA